MSSHRFLISYGSSRPSITPSLFLAHSKIDVDECYTLAQRDYKYTLIHVRHRLPKSTITSFMCRMKEVYGIESANVFGYDAVSFQKEIDEHPGMMLIINAVKSGFSELDIWTHHKDLYLYRRGLLFPYLPGQPLDQMTRGQILRRAKELEEQLAEAKAKWIDVEDHQLDSGLKKSFPSVRTVLMKYRRDRASRALMKSVMKWEKASKKQCTRSKTGEIYAAWNPLMPSLHKLGFTLQDAETRVKSLQTAGVLEPFTLVRHAQVPNARRFEKAMHIYFRDLRVYKRKEFFVVDADEINSFFDIVENKVEGNTDETEQWQYALQKAK